MTDLAGRSDCRDTRKFKNRHLVLALLLAFALSAGYSHAQDLQRSDRLCRPVLIVSDDEDPDTVIRSSAAAKQARAELARSLQFYGFRAIDEDQWSSGLGFPISDRNSTSDLLTMVDLARRMPPYVEHVAVLRTRAWVEESSKTGWGTPDPDRELRSMISSPRDSSPAPRKPSQLS